MKHSLTDEARGGAHGKREEVFAAHIGLCPGDVVADVPTGGALAKKITIVKGAVQPGTSLGVFCDTIKRTGSGECLETVTNGTATASAFPGKRFDYDNETDTVVITN